MKLSAVNIKKDFLRESRESNYFTAVKPLDFELQSGQMIEITGRSGSGKSTLLCILAGILAPSDGKVLLGDIDLYALSEKKLARLRNERLGFVPQGHTALPSLTVLENVLLPHVLYHRDPPPESRAIQLLDQLGLGDLLQVKPNELSGGELRRLAVARALLTKPDFLLADEPTAGLDEQSIQSVLHLLRSAADEGTAVLIVTHEQETAQFADITYTMSDGVLAPGR